MKEFIAAFDFDGTLYQGESGFDFFNYYLGTLGFYGFILGNFPDLLKYKLAWHDEAALAKIVRSVFKDKLKKDVEEVAKKFVIETVSKKLINSTYAKLKWHQAQNHRCIIVSRSLPCYLVYWATSRGIKDIICTELEVNAQGFYTGELVEPSCHGVYKVKYLERLLGDRSNFEIYAYGDSAGDRELIAWADHGTWINKED